jgi:hypothetical protein
MQMSVVHYGVTKATTYTEPLGSKEQLLLVTGACLCRVAVWLCAGWHRQESRESCGTRSSPAWNLSVMAVLDSANKD